MASKRKIKTHIVTRDKVYKTLKKPSTKDVLEKYIPLYKYKNNFYLYAPCDWSYNFTVEVSAKKISFNSSERIEFEIKSKKNNQKSKSSRYKFRRSNKKQKGSFELKRFKNRKNIFISKIIIANQEPIYKLFINSKDIDSFKIINNNCIHEKVSEFEFEELDLKNDF